MHPDVVPHDLEHGLAVLVHQAVAHAERQAAKRRARLVWRHGLPRVVPLERDEVGDLRALEVDDRQELAGRGGDGAAVGGGDDDGTLFRVAHAILRVRGCPDTLGSGSVQVKLAAPVVALR